jgi:hypothetical protein
MNNCEILPFTYRRPSGCQTRKAFPKLTGRIGIDTDSIVRAVLDVVH